MKALITAALFAGLASPAAAAVHVIDFEDRADGNQGTAVMVYPQATFTGTGNLFVNGAGMGKDLCTFGTLGCNGVMQVAFASPVSNLSFTTLGDNIVSSLFVTLQFQSGAPLGLVRPLDGNTFVKDFHDFSAYSNITGLILSSDDLLGVAYDDFRFETAAGGAVPEPAAWALMIAGFGLVGAAARRRGVPAVAA